MFVIFALVWLVAPGPGETRRRGRLRRHLCLLFTPVLLLVFQSLSRVCRAGGVWSVLEPPRPSHPGWRPGLLGLESSAVSLPPTSLERPSVDSCPLSLLYYCHNKPKRFFFAVISMTSVEGKELNLRVLLASLTESLSHCVWRSRAVNVTFLLLQISLSTVIRNITLNLFPSRNL